MNQDQKSEERLGGAPEIRQVRLGFIALSDCAPLVIAQEKGLFRKWGLDVALSREASWANIRDKVALSTLDGGHMLAALPLAATLGLGGIARPMITSFVLNLNGNAITLSQSLWEQMVHADPAVAVERPVTAQSLRKVIELRRSIGAPSLVFAMTFPYSSHNYLLRYWLAAAGIDPDEDVRLVVVPPPMMVVNLMARHIDGFCVGAPWNQRAVELGIGRVALSSYELWANHAEKVFGVARDWAERHPTTHKALIAALIEAAAWLDEPANRREAARILSGHAYVDAPEEVVAMGLLGTLKYGPNELMRSVPDYIVYSRNAANFPWLSQAEWTLTQMQRWGQIDNAVDIATTAAAAYRPDIYREVAMALGAPCPLVDRKHEGAHAGPWTLPGTSGPVSLGSDMFFDGRLFDPTNPAAYLAGLDAIALRQTQGAGKRRNA